MSIGERCGVIQPDKQRTCLDVESARLDVADRLLLDAGWLYPNHSHDCWEFVYFVRGTGSVVLPTCTVRPQPYHLIIYPPGLSHAESVDIFDSEEIIYFRAIVSGAVQADAPFLLPDSNGNILWLCEQILAEYRSNGNSLLANAYLKTFLLLVERIWETGVLVEPDIVDTAVRYLKSSYSEDADLRLLSEVCNVSANYLARVFRTKLGVSPMHYLQSIRIDAAKRLLMTTNIPVKEIAKQIGFCDPLYFSKAFKHSTGYSPTEFRSQKG